MAATRKLAVALALCIGASAQAAILPEERADAMYHRYDGDGVTVDGPSVLVRKNFRESVSVSANYLVDNVSSASIDVVTSGASAYTEKRTEYTVAGDYLYGKSMFSAGISNSSESDYEADTLFFNISQDFFGDLTTLGFGYSQGQDEVFQNGNDDFAGEIKRHNYRVSLSQVITPRMIMGLNYELVTDEGFLNNPYRNYRYLSDPLDLTAGFQLAQEVYPNTRTSDAAALRLKYYLPWRASVGGSYRYFTDDWEIDAHTAQLDYTQVLYDNWTFDLKYRYYTQTAAEFYSDLFLTPSQDEKDYRARDKELSDFNNHTASAHVSYGRDFDSRYLDSAAISLQYDRIWFTYNNFTDLRDTGAVPGDERLFSFEADVIKLLFTVWY